MAVESRFMVMTIECPHCKTKQKVHVAAGVRTGRMPTQYVFCIDCDSEFPVRASSKIVGGPFPT